MEPDSDELRVSYPIRNLVFVGSKGSGKTTTCDKISGVHSLSKSSSSQTRIINCVHEIHDPKRFKLYDTDAFEKGIFEHQSIRKMYQSLFTIFVDPRHHSTKQIDAFILVFKMNPRPQTLKADLERLRDIFGSIAFHSLILLPIYSDVEEYQKIHHEHVPNTKDFLEKLREMDEVVRIIKEGREDEPNESWFCLWDNLNPREGQERELLDKIQRMEPYTGKRFMLSEHEVKERIRMRYKEGLSNEIVKIKKEFEEDKERQEKEILEVEREYDEKKKALFEMREYAEASIGELSTLVKSVNANTKAALQVLYEDLMYERQKTVERFLDQIEGKHVEYDKKLDEYLKTNQKMLKNFEEKLEQKILENEEVQENRRYGEKIMALLLLKGEGEKDEKTKQMIKETAERHAKLMVETGAKQAAKKGFHEVKKTAKNAAKAAAKNLFKSKKCNIF